MFRAKLGGGDAVEGDFRDGGSIGLEDSVFLPFLRVFLLCLNESVSLFRLFEFNVSLSLMEGMAGYLRPSTPWFWRCWRSRELLRSLLLLPW